jgi:hypothetical protein
MAYTGTLHVLILTEILTGRSELMWTFGSVDVDRGMVLIWTLKK